MSGLARNLEFAMAGAEMMVLILGLAVAVIMPAADRWSKRFFIVFFSVLTVYGGLCMAEGIMQELPYLRALENVFYYFETLLASLLTPMLTVFLLHSCGKKPRGSALFRAVAALWAAGFILLNLTLFTDWVYSVSPENELIRGPLYGPTILLMIAIPVLDLICVFRWRSLMPGRYLYAFIVGLVPVTAALMVHLYVSVFAFLSFGIAVCALSMFGIILFDQIDRSMRQQREIAHQRASIMVLQMRPHFIYNTMMSIYYLCRQNPDLAQQVTLDFTTYLRKNFTAIASEELIPFTEELEHTRAYLAVEQAQFEDSLFIEYDTPHTQFSLPPLTLQPIVENAVKHGMDPDSEPLHIRIRTAAAGSGSEIIVEDTGAGFRPEDDGEPHTAIKNIRQRLEMMCGGKLTITPREGGGTVVRVTIP